MLTLTLKVVMGGDIVLGSISIDSQDGSFHLTTVNQQRISEKLNSMVEEIHMMLLNTQLKL